MNTAVANVDQPTEKPIVVFNRQLENAAHQFQQALPAHIPLERFKRVIMTAVQNNPDLMAADRYTFWTSAMKAASDGLLPDGREGALVVFNTEMKVIVKGKEVKQYIKAVQWMPMIAGLRKKVRNSKEIATWDAHVVHAKDKFEYELGDDPFIKHIPSMEPDPGEVIAAYSVATLKTGEKSREVMSRAQIDKIRSKSKAPNSPAWRDWFEEMARKCVARRHSKVLPMSTDLDDLLRHDEELYDLKGAREQDPGPDRPKLSEFMTPPKIVEESEAAKPAENITENITEGAQEPEQAHDAETGEVASGAPSPADAFALGRKARSEGFMLKSVPPEWRDEAHEPLATAWKAGWNERDAEIAAKVKGQ